MSQTANISTATTMADLLTTEGVDIKVPKVGDVLEGRILTVSKNEVVVDIDSFGLGVVRGRELYDEAVRLDALKVGDSVFASVVEPENKEGNIELSFRAAGQERVWSTLTDRMSKREIITTKILDANKGGLMVEINASLASCRFPSFRPNTTRA